MSAKTGPLTLEPSPYWISKVPVFLDDVDDLDDVYLDFLVQVELVHDDEGTQRSEEPAAARNVREKNYYSR